MKRVLLVVVCLCVSLVWAVDIDSCQSLGSPGVYTLNQSVVSNTSCMSMTAVNITLDCQGFSITFDLAGNSSGSSQHRGVSMSTGSVVRNCIISDGNSSGSQSRGIILGENVLVVNNTITVNGTSDNFAVFSGLNATITNNTLRAVGTGNRNIGAHIGHNNRLLYNNISTFASFAAYGVYMFSGVQNNTIAFNTIVTNCSVFSSSAVTMQSDVVGNRVYGNRLSTVGPGGSNYGVWITDGSIGNSAYENNISTIDGSEGVAVQDQSINNTIGRNDYQNVSGSAITISTSNGTLINDSLDTTVSYSLAGVGDLKIETSDGSIVWNGSMSGSGSNLGAHVMISDGMVQVNSSAAPHFNRSAQVVLSGVSFIDPAVIVDLEDDGSFVSCPASLCSEVSYENNEFVFTVAHFTSFAAQEVGSVPEFGTLVILAVVAGLTGVFVMRRQHL